MSSLRPTVFTDLAGRSQTLYFTGNPWKTLNSIQKIYRFDVVTKENRYSNVLWDHLIRFQPPTRKETFQVLIPDECWGIFEDKSFIAPGQEYVSIFPGKVHTNCDDRVYRGDESSFPENIAVEVMRKLESMPIDARIHEVDHLYWEYIKRNAIYPLEKISDTDDPFLQALVEYRNTCVDILASAEERRSMDIRITIVTTSQFNNAPESVESGYRV